MVKDVNSVHHGWMSTLDASTVSAISNVLAGRRWVALTGAGISTDSGIPDYRGPDAAPTNPITFNEFLGYPEARRRYWARSMQGWRSFRSARPNDGHHALARLGVPIITQNVDGLHQAAGSHRVLDLHGRIDKATCLDCGFSLARAGLQEMLTRLNPTAVGIEPAGHAELRPDGDADVEVPDGFEIPSCPRCGGVWKPDVVFFGESVPPDRVDRAFSWLEAADALVVAGSSLTVMSGLRFARRAAADGKPLVIINRGQTRADELATLKVDAGTTEVLSALADV